MNHQGIEDDDRLEAYVTGRMGPDERAELEAHLVDCPVCLGRVEAAQGLLRGIHALGDELPGTEQPRRSRWIRRAAVTLAALAAVAVAIVWGAARERALERALERERAAAATARQEVATLAARLPAPESARPPERSPPLPPGRVPVLSLIATRGTDVPTLALPPSGTPVVLLVERESPPRFGRYRVTLQGPGNDQVLQEELAPSSRDVVAVGLDPAVLRPGLHVLTLEGLPGRGGTAPVGRHRFQVAPAR
ncbi:MAG TPA: zf-HC2 domain-containing protein [Myxococcaceae bacterium]|nr:zf-HC2 domain-containing protein [Myxococcaceae bacterium]